MPLRGHDGARRAHRRHVPLLHGSREALTAFSARITGLRDLDDATSVLLEYEGGELASINTTYFSPPVVSLSVFGTDAAAWNEEDGARLFVQARTDPVRAEQQVETIDTISDEIAEFARCIREGSRPETGVAEAIEVGAVLDAIGRSIESGCAVELASCGDTSAAPAESRPTCLDNGSHIL